MFLAAKIAIATAWKIYVIDIALMKRKRMWLMLNEKIPSVLRENNPFLIKCGPPGLPICRSLIHRVVFIDDRRRVPVSFFSPLCFVPTLASCFCSALYNPPPFFYCNPDPPGHILGNMVPHLSKRYYCHQHYFIVIML